MKSIVQDTSIYPSLYRFGMEQEELKSIVQDTSIYPSLYRFGMEQDELKSIVQDILELDLNNDWEVGAQMEYKRKVI